MCTYLDQSLSPHIAIYSQDGFGLGHLRRNSAIASQVLRTCPEAGILTLSDSQLGRFFDTPPNHDYIKLPSIVKVGPGDWKAVNLPLPFKNIQAIRQELIRITLLSYRPDILLVDHMPHGAMGELLPALEGLKASGIGTKIVLGLRDILDAPNVIEKRWKTEGAFDALERYYDMVMVYGMRQVYDLAEEYHFPSRIKELIHYVGYVCTPAAPRYSQRTRTQYLNSMEKGTQMIVAMAGGGLDAYPMMRSLLEAFPSVLKKQSAFLVMITGPFMPVEERHLLEAKARGLPVKVRASVSDSLSYIDAADLVVAMAGYNTTMEILRSRKPAILIPRAGPSAEQRTRARLFAARCWVDMIDPDDLSIDTVARSILTGLSQGPILQDTERPDLAGIEAAVDRVFDILPPDHIEENHGLPVSKIFVDQPPAFLS